MELLKHFSHEHLLNLIHVQPYQNNEDSDNQDEDEDENENPDNFVVENRHVGKCEMCLEEIYSFQLCYYSCNDCEYSLHKSCAKLPTIEQNHPFHPGHKLTLSLGWQMHDHDVRLNDREWRCHICNIIRVRFYNYHCSICKFNMDIICATMFEQKMDHPSHPHQLQRHFTQMTSCCNACGEEHSGVFYLCTTCSVFKIHLDCALLPPKILIQQFTNEQFSHSHLLILSFSFPYVEKEAIFFPSCRVCDDGFSSFQWLYNCNKCRYYVHVLCATSRTEAFMSSILLPTGLGKLYKNFKDDDHPNLICCPFPDESFSLLKHHLFYKEKVITQGKIANDGEMFKHSSHQHMLTLFETQAFNKSVSLHDPMKKVQLLCDGCVRPITNVPLCLCSQHDCGFALHEWCTRLPSKINLAHHDHPLVLLHNIPTKLFGAFICEICNLPSNGFAYGCMQCDYYVDINCGFIPDEITHEAHPNHLLIKIKTLRSGRYCKACSNSLKEQLGFHCPTCDFYLHITCALLLPKTIRHKHDKHALSLSYGPVENHSSKYFCEICEEEFDPKNWFYHCNTCAYSMHTACAPLILQSQFFMSNNYRESVFWFLNVKFGRRYEIGVHQHIVTFAQGIYGDGQCIVCHESLQNTITLKCFECKFSIHGYCLRFFFSPANMGFIS